jgi:hypothetical protein
MYINRFNKIITFLSITLRKRFSVENFSKYALIYE